MKATIEDIKYLRHVVNQIKDKLSANIPDDIERMAVEDIAQDIDTDLVAWLEIAEDNCNDE